MSKIPSAFKLNPMNAFYSFTLMTIWGAMFGTPAFLLAFMVSLAFFPIFEEKK